MDHKYKSKVKLLRSTGKTFSEIQAELSIKIPKSTLSNWSKDITLPETYKKRVKKLNEENLDLARKLAWKANKEKRDKYLAKIKRSLTPVSKLIQKKNVAKLFLTALYLGEGKKGIKNRQLCLGNSDPKIVKIFLNLLRSAYNFDISKVRCTVQCRADQNSDSLENYWSKETGIPKSQFYKARIDPRTAGKPTKKKDYKGVLRVDYFDSRIHIELEYVAILVAEYLEKQWADSSAG